MICIFNNKKFVSELISALIVLILCSQVFAYEKSMEYDFTLYSGDELFWE
ncbi:hypothetical protein J2Z80_002605 [Thermoanaerobacterium butyriciformans]|uniref:Uncharacterized protein n=1 Tax=Thermoanaerobacterium butyriciformans TaxID=1702242 RepID=A0ABS4NHA5_9THEO|nr:hypothetical protein [Thermoanaerobacterium butyriciformans]